MDSPKVHEPRPTKRPIRIPENVERWLMRKPSSTVAISWRPPIHSN